MGTHERRAGFQDPTGASGYPRCAPVGCFREAKGAEDPSWGARGTVTFHRRVLSQWREIQTHFPSAVVLGHSPVPVWVTVHGLGTKARLPTACPLPCPLALLGTLPLGT